MPFPSTLTGWRQVSPPPSASRVFYAYRIMVPIVAGNQRNMTVVGTFQNFNPTSTRQVVRVRGIANNGGYPLELVPGPSDTTINVTYLALYLLPLNEALGYNIGSAVDLNRQRVAFDIQELCVFPQDYMSQASQVESQRPFGSSIGNQQQMKTIEVNHYRECYLSNVGRTVNQGTVTIAETATIQVTAIEPTKFPGGSPTEYGETGYNSPNVFPGGALQ